MPGCLGLDAMWQMVGFFLGWMGGKGRGRAAGVGEVKFTDMVKPDARLVTYVIDMKIDGRIAYEAKDLRVLLAPDAPAAAT